MEAAGWIVTPIVAWVILTIAVAVFTPCLRKVIEAEDKGDEPFSGGVVTALAVSGVIGVISAMFAVGSTLSYGVRPTVWAAATDPTFALAAGLLGKL